MSHKEQFLEWATGRDYIVSELEGCSLKVGDRVIHTNDFGVSFTHEVVGFESPEHTKECFPSQSNEPRVYIDSDSYWYPVRVSSCTKIK